MRNKKQEVLRGMCEARYESAWSEVRMTVIIIIIIFFIYLYYLLQLL